MAEFDRKYAEVLSMFWLKILAMTLSFNVPGH